MKKLDLNIKLKEPNKKDDGTQGEQLTPLELGKKWIGIMVERAINKPDPTTGRARMAVNMDVQRQYFKLIDVIDESKDGIVEMEEEVFSFMDRKFHQAEMIVQKDIAEILVRLDEAINLAKIPPKKLPKKEGEGK